MEIMLDKSEMDIGNLINGVNDNIIRKIKDTIMDNRTKALKKHNRKISTLKDGRYATYVDDMTKKEGRHKLIAPTYEDLLDKLAAWYFKEEAIIPVKAIQKVLTLKSLYSKWSREKQLDGRSSNPTRLWYDWKKYCLEEELSHDLIEKPLGSITSLELKEWVNALNDKYNFNVHQYYNATSPVRQILEYATEQGYIKANPYSKNLISKKKFIQEEKEEPETQVFFVDEIEELWNLAHDGTATGIAICFMLKTGLRRAELLGLKYSDLSKSGTYLSINRQYVFDFEFDKNGKPTKKIPHLVERTKTKAGKRKIYLVHNARELLNELNEYNKLHNLTGEFIFQSEFYEDFHMGYEAVEKKLYRICDKMKTIPKSQHKLRKTFVSKLLDDGINIDEVRRIAGHENEKTTLRNYCYNRYNKTQTEDMLEKALA